MKRFNRHNSIEYLYNTTRQFCTLSNVPFDIGLKLFEDLINQKKCIHCEVEIPTRAYLKLKHGELGYIYNNIEPICYSCYRKLRESSRLKDLKKMRVINSQISNLISFQKGLSINEP